MTDKLAAVYTTAGNANDALVIPAAWRSRGREPQRPELALQVADRVRSDLAGTYLAACVVMARTIGARRFGNTYHATSTTRPRPFCRTLRGNSARLLPTMRANRANGALHG